MSIKQTIQSQFKSAKANTVTSVKAKTIEPFMEEVHKGIAKADLMERRLRIAAFHGEGEVPAEPTIHSKQKVEVVEPEPVVYTDYQEHYRETAPKRGWIPCSFREIREGDWVRVTFTGKAEDARYGLVREFTDKNWWKTAEGVLVVGPVAIRSGRGNLTTGTLVFNKNMVLSRVPASQETLAQIAEAQSLAMKLNIAPGSPADKALIAATSFLEKAQNFLQKKLKK